MIAASPPGGGAGAGVDTGACSAGFGSASPPKRGESSGCLRRKLALVFPYFVDLPARKTKGGRNVVARPPRFLQFPVKPFLVEEKRHRACSASA